MYSTTWKTRDYFVPVCSPQVKKKTCSVFLQSAIGGKTEFPAFGSAPPVVSNRRPAAAVGHTAAQEGIIPLFLLRSAIVRRL